MRKVYFTLAMAILGIASVSAQEFDDIYYNPKKDIDSKEYIARRKSNYIKDFASLDVDQYNRRGQYYASPVDTIGKGIENGSDFVYTQQIQKYYNPTIVVDNSVILQDVLANSYGNVEIVLDNGYPTFGLWNSPYYYGYYNRWNSPWYWGWNSPWYGGPSYAWGWDPYWDYPWYGPGWGWNSGWNWGWGPTWGWTPSWGGYHPHHYADYRPNGRYPNRPGSHWASNSKPDSGRRPGSMMTSGYTDNNGNTVNSRPYQGAISGYGQTGTTSGRYSNSSSNSSSRGYSINGSGHRVYNSGSSTSSSNSTSNYRSSSNSSYNRGSSSSSSSSSRSSYNSSSRSSGSSSGSFGGSSHSSGGGGSRGRHR